MDGFQLILQVANQFHCKINQPKGVSIPNLIKIIAFCLHPVCPPNWVPYPSDWPTDCFYCGFAETSLSQLKVDETRLRCKEINGSLISIHNVEENYFIAQNLNSSHIHLNGLLKYDNWVWLDGTAFSYNNWGTTEWEPGECLVLVEGGFWRAADCNITSSQFVCRIGYGKLWRGNE